ncbi:MAG: hypothetical protein LIO44_02945 [Eubacterium sp.]|nr:hypothetical protein [Eubacterium sp.]
MKKFFSSVFVKVFVLLLSAFCVYSLVYMALYIDNADYRIGETEYTDSYAYQSQIQDYFEILDNAVYEKSYSQKAIILKKVDSSKVKYYINQNGEELTNFKADINSYKDFASYYLYNASEGIAVSFPDSLSHFSYISKTNGLNILYVGFDLEGFVYEEMDWISQSGNVQAYIANLPFILILFAACLIYFTVTAGASESGEIHLSFFDKIYGEIVIAAVLIIFSVGLSCFIILWDMTSIKNLPFRTGCFLTGTAAFITFLLILAAWISLVKSV